MSTGRLHVASTATYTVAAETVSPQRLLAGWESDELMLESQVNTTESSASSAEGFFMHHFKDSIVCILLLGSNKIPWSTGRNVIDYHTLFSQMSRE